jgi:hypothetical protein
MLPVYRDTKPKTSEFEAEVSAPLAIYCFTQFDKILNGFVVLVQVIEIFKSFLIIFFV